MRLSLGALLIAAAALLTAQDDTTIRVNTRLVEVDVVVHRKGAPVDDLRAEDFTVFDQGKPQKVAAFAVRRDSDIGEARRLEPGEVSNRMNRQLTGEAQEAASPTIILLDTLNSDPEDMFEMRRQLALYLDRVNRHEAIAIYSLNKTLSIVQDFTDDQDKLRSIVARWKAVASVDVTASALIDPNVDVGDPLTTAMLRAAQQEMIDASNLNRAEITAWALETIAKHLKGVPGRKKLIWAGAAFAARTSDVRGRLGSKQIEIREYSGYITKAVRALNEAQVAVYPVDPRNPCKPNCGGPAFSAVGIETMNLFASGTGGRAFYVLSDIAAAVEEVFEDSSVTYALGFYPNTKLDGKFHDLKVKVARSGVEVRYRPGYVASDDKPPATDERRQNLREVMQAPLNTTEIGLAGRFTPNAASDDLPFELRIDVRDLQLNTETRDGATVWVALLTVGTMFPDAAKLEDLRDIKVTLGEKRLSEVLRDGYLLPLTSKRLDKAKQFRVVVQDRIGGRAGTLTIAIPQ